jgi:hypothetical protein
MATVITAINKTASPVPIDDLGVTVPASGELPLSLFFEVVEINKSSNLTQLIEDDKIRIHDGEIELTKYYSLKHTNFKTEYQDKDLMLAVLIVIKDTPQVVTTSWEPVPFEVVDLETDPPTLNWDRTDYDDVLVGGTGLFEGSISLEIDTTIGDQFELQAVKNGSIVITSSIKAVTASTNVARFTYTFLMADLLREDTVGIQIRQISGGSSTIRTSGRWTFIKLDGIEGPEGEQGIQGIIGGQILYGDIVPTIEGVHSDIYIHRPSSDLYKNIDGIWTGPFHNIKGDPGTNGIDGIDGQDGQQGIPGPQGSGANINVYKDGVSVVVADIIDLKGPNITVTGSGNIAEITISDDDTHNHDDVYYTETEVDNIVANLSLIEHDHDDRYYTETETNNLLNNLTASFVSKVQEDGLLKASGVQTLNFTGNVDITNSGNDIVEVNITPYDHDHNDIYYTETEIDDLFTNFSHVDHTHDGRYYTETEIDAIIDGLQVGVHDHNDTYYTETEVDTLIANIDTSPGGVANDIHYLTASYDRPYYKFKDDYVWKTGPSFIFRGTDLLGTPSQAKILVSTNESNTSGSIRLYDETNDQVVASWDNINSKNTLVIKEADLSNLPTGEAIITIQGYTNKRYLYLHSMHFHFDGGS